jgi:hypothetical protein
MRRSVKAVLFVALYGVQACADRLLGQQEPSNPSRQEAVGKQGSASLRVCLRLPDQSTFLGKATVRLSPEEGSAVIGQLPEFEGYFVFANVLPGKYELQVGATGYQEARLSTEVEAGHGERTLFVVMQPRTMPETAENGSAEAKATTEATAREGSAAPLKAGKSGPRPAHGYWTPGELESVVPAVDPTVACSMQDVLNGVGRRMSEFVSNLERFTATERVEHYAVNGEKTVGPPEVRNFDYMVSVSQNKVGTFLLEEYRDGFENSGAFPAHVATHGLPAMALLFHPVVASDFQFLCEGLGQWGGRAAWQVHFVQRSDRPVRMRAYVVNGNSYSVEMEGRAWIDPGSYQVVRLESEMAKPIPEIKLTQEHITIEYAPVQFRIQNINIWLPQSAELYVERRGKRFFRRHTFSDFRVFSIETTESVQAPREAYSFTNLSDRDIAGVLTVVPEMGAKHQPVMLKFTVPARGRVFKAVGLGKDVNLPVAEVASATFAHNGQDGTIKVDASLAKETTLDVIPGNVPQ